MDPWVFGSLAIWLPRRRAAAGSPGGLPDPPAGLLEPFAREMAGDWRAAWHRLSRPYDAALAGLGSPDEAALREALKTLDDLGARAIAAAARRLVISERTVDHHVSAVLSKIGVSSRAEAARAAARMGIAATN